jgi:hypothetical protein
VRVLCNLPLECFEAREHFSGIELTTFGPPDRMWVDGTFYPFDVEFDPSAGTLAELFSRLPADYRPDLILVYWPDQEPLPSGLEDSPVPVVGILSDYNLSISHTRGLWPFFDVLLVDRAGVDCFAKLSFPDVRYFCQFSFKRPFHRLYPDIPRDLDVAFCGNLNPIIQKARTPWIQRVRDLSRLGVRAEVATGIHGEAYGRFLNRTKIGFNHSIRGEMNLRAFEVPACGALLFMEDTNREVRDFLTPDEEVVLYNQENFEERVGELLGDESRRQRMADAGHRRIQQFSMAKRLPVLLDLMEKPGPGRPPSTPFDRLLGRGIAMLGTWAQGSAILRPLIEAADLRPDDPRPLNALALALLRSTADQHSRQVVDLFEKACAISPTYVPAALNLLTLLEASDRGDLARPVRDSLVERLSQAPDFADLDGPVLPLGFSERAVAVAGALVEALREGNPPTALEAWAPGLVPASTG